MIYSPREDSHLIAKEVSKYSREKKVLDMGTGSGILAKTAQKSGAKSVLASDINPEAVQEAKNQGIPSIPSNLFSKIKGEFDLITFNPPYLPKDSREPKDAELTNSGGKRGDELIIKFLKQAPKHLTHEGIILLLVSSLTPKNKITLLLKKLNLNYSILSSQKLFFEELQVWEVKRIKQ